MALPLVLLLVALGGIALVVRRDAAAYRRFKLITDTAVRQRWFRRWIVVTFTAFTGYTLLSLALLGRLGDLGQLPDEFISIWAVLGGGPALSDMPFGAVALGMAIGAPLAGLGGMLIAWRRRTRPGATRQIGDVWALLPRNRAELLHAAALSVNAGLSEELFFRLALPLLFVLVTGNAWLAFALATIVFGLVHLYQGWAGVIATTVIGAILAAIYLATGNIWIAVLVHAVFDLAALVLRPLLSGAVTATGRKV